MLALGAAASGVEAQSTLPVGHEFQVTAYTSSGQRRPALAMDETGAFVVAWWGRGATGDPNGDVFARRFDAMGSALAGEFQVNDYQFGGQSYPAIARAGNGSFVIAWTDVQEEGIFARRFDAAGARQASEFQVNTHTVGVQNDVVLAVRSDGGFVAVWEGGVTADFEVFGRVFDSTGVGVGVEFRINDYTTGAQAVPRVASDLAGSFVVTWDSEGQDGSFRGAFARRFDSGGAAQASEFQVNVATLDDQLFPDVAVGAAGDFVVVWESVFGDGSFEGVLGRRFGSGGVALGSQFQVNSYTPGEQYRVAVAVESAGAFVVVWESAGQDGSGYGIFARNFDSTGEPQAAEFQVNSYTPGAQRYPRVAIDSEGAFVIAWQSEGQDGDIGGVFARRFVTLRVLDVDGDQSVLALTDGLLVLRYLFGFDGAVLTAGAIGAECTRCTPEAVVGYLAALGATLDVDGNGASGALTDGLLVLRYLFGFDGLTLTTGAVAGGCTRCDAAAIEPYVKPLVV